MKRDRRTARQRAAHTHAVATDKSVQCDESAIATGTVTDRGVPGDNQSSQCTALRPHAGATYCRPCGTQTQDAKSNMHRSLRA